MLRSNSDAGGRGNKVPGPGDFSEVQKTEGGKRKVRFRLQWKRHGPLVTLSVSEFVAVSTGRDGGGGVNVTRRGLNWSRRTSLVRPPFCGLDSVLRRKRFSNSEIRKIGKISHKRKAPQPAAVLKKTHRRGCPVTLLNTSGMSPTVCSPGSPSAAPATLPAENLRQTGARHQRTTRSHTGDCRLCFT